MRFLCVVKVGITSKHALHTLTKYNHSTYFLFKLIEGEWRKYTEIVYIAHNGTFLIIIIFI